MHTLLDEPSPPLQGKIDKLDQQEEPLQEKPAKQRKARRAAQQAGAEGAATQGGAAAAGGAAKPARKRTAAEAAGQGEGGVAKKKRKVGGVEALCWCSVAELCHRPSWQRAGDAEQPQAERAPAAVERKPLHALCQLAGCEPGVVSEL